MIDRLHDALPYLEQLPPEAQEEAATFIEALAEAFEHEGFAPGCIRCIPDGMQSGDSWVDPAGAWRDLPDSMLEELDQLRHASPPTSPFRPLRG